MSIKEIYKNQAYVALNTPEPERFVWAFKYWRLRGKPARDAYASAKEDAAKGVTRYPSSAVKLGYGSSGQPWKGYGSDHMRWLENPEAAGLRYKGFADEQDCRGIRHKGWFLDSEFQSEVARGVVFQMAARGGKERYVAGYADPYNDGPVALSFDTIYDDIQDAAYAADRIAEKYAEEEREYQDAWRAGNDYAELGDEVKENRKVILELIAEIKKLRTPDCKFPAVALALREALEKRLRGIQAARKKRAELLDSYDVSWRGNARDAFKEAAGV